MKKILIGIAVMLCVTQAQSATIATMPNQAGGKIVLTDEQCKYGGKTYDPLKRSYFYTPEGINGEGCWHLEDETIVVVWKDKSGASSTRRYPANGFDIRR